LGVTSQESAEYCACFFYKSKKEELRMKKIMATAAIVLFGLFGTASAGPLEESRALDKQLNPEQREFCKGLSGTGMILINEANHKNLTLEEAAKNHEGKGYFIIMFTHNVAKSMEKHNVSSADQAGVYSFIECARIIRLHPEAMKKAKVKEMKRQAAAAEES
jgi:hypothetical protein